MYKKHFKNWEIHKNTNRATKVALLYVTAARDRAGKKTPIEKDKKLWSGEHTLTRRKLKYLKVDNLCPLNSNYTELPPGYDCVTPPPESIRYLDQADQVCGYTTVGPIHTLAPRPEPPPDVFLALCYHACTLRAAGQHRDADSVLQRASHVVASMVQDFQGQFHGQLLACNNRASIYLFMERKGDDAVAVLESTRKAVLRCVGDADPIVLSIEDMIWEASRAKVAKAMIPLEMMRTVTEAFRSRWGERHPSTVLAAYKLAWRLTMSETHLSHKLEALQILSRIKNDADVGLGPHDLISIAIITTKARVLETLGKVFVAAKTMAEATRRIDVTYKPLHPYRLETQSRHAELLLLTGQVSEAEQAFIQVALGRTEVLGADHPYSKASKYDVLTFLNTGCRSKELQSLNDQLTHATQRSQTRHRVFPW